MPSIELADTERETMDQSTFTEIGIAVFAACLIASCNRKSEPLPTPPPVQSSAVAPKPTNSTITTQGPFEGEIQMQLTQAGEKAKTIVYEVKADRVRYEEGSPSASAYTIANLGQKRAYAVADARKDYIEVDPATSESTRTDPVVVKKSGKTENVRGFECEDWQVKVGKEELDICAAKEIAYYDLISPVPAAAAEPAWAGELTKAKAFPLRVIGHDTKGNEEFRAEATTILRKPVDSNRFAIPTGYKKALMSKDVSLFGIE